jgi:fluoride exporter
MRTILIIGTGGFIGSVARYATAQYINVSWSSSFPAGTFVVNLIGCLLIGVFFGLFERGGIMNTEWRLFLTVGFCGGFTTFSTFSNDNLLLLRAGEYFYLTLYAALSMVLGLFATWLGYSLTRLVK